jgi:hypothetical protein
VSQALEKLRKKAQYQPTHGGARFRGPYSQKIVNRFLELYARQELRPVWHTRAEIEANLEFREVLR